VALAGLMGSKGGLIPPENPIPGAKLYRPRLNPWLRAHTDMTATAMHML